MAIYQPNGSGIGTLLRMIKEQRSQGPIVPPSSEVASPIRDTIQGPVKTPESPGTSRVISIRPESNTNGPVQSPVSVGPVAPVAPSVAPVAPVGPVVTAPVTNAKTVEGPMVAKVTGAPVSAPAVKSPSLATTIKPSTPTLSPSITPTRSRSGTLVAEPAPNPSPTPAPAQPSAGSGYVKTYPQTGSTSAAPTPGPTPTQSLNPLRPSAQGPSLATKIIDVLKQSPFGWLTSRK